MRSKRIYESNDIINFLIHVDQEIKHENVEVSSSKQRFRPQKKGFDVIATLNLSSPGGVYFGYHIHYLVFNY